MFQEDKEIGEQKLYKFIYFKQYYTYVVPDDLDNYSSYNKIGTKKCVEYVFINQNYEEIIKIINSDYPCSEFQFQKKYLNVNDIHKTLLCEKKEEHEYEILEDINELGRSINLLYNKIIPVSLTPVK